MNVKNDIARMTFDIPKKDHKRLKAMAAALGKSMREVVIESIDDYFHKLNIPNKKTLKAIDNIEKGKNLVAAKDAEDLFKKLGI